MAGVQRQGHEAEEASASTGHSTPPRKIRVITCQGNALAVKLLHFTEQILHLILAKRPRKVCSTLFGR